MDNALILSHLDAGVLTLTLNRPDRLNSFNDEMHRQLSEALTQAERDDSVRCLLIAGAGRGFAPGRISTIATSAPINRRRISACRSNVSTTPDPSPDRPAEAGGVRGQRRGGRRRRRAGPGVRYRHRRRQCQLHSVVLPSGAGT